MAKTRTMSSTTPTTTPLGPITGGVDTHKDFHVAAAKDALGQDLGTHTFPTTHAGYTDLIAWLSSFGPLAVVGVEGTSSYGAALTTQLSAAGIDVVEINRPNRQNRRLRGKSDPADAIAAAAAVQAGDAHITPKTHTNPVESIRLLRETRGHLITARTAAINTLHALVVTAPPALRESLHGLSLTRLVGRCAAFGGPDLPAPRPGGKARAAAATALVRSLLDPATAIHLALGELARTIGYYEQRLADLDTLLDAVVGHVAPRTIALFALGTQTTAQLLITAGGNPDRIHSETAMARLTGTAPQDCSSGKQQHHRLSRAGDRQANAALYRVVLTRLAWHGPTRAYMKARLVPNGGNKKHLIRCLKRYLAREIYPRLMADLADLVTLHIT